MMMSTQVSFTLNEAHFISEEIIVRRWHWKSMRKSIEKKTLNMKMEMKIPMNAFARPKNSLEACDRR